MKYKSLLAEYAGLLLLEVLTRLNSWDSLHVFTKTALLPSLMAFVALQKASHFRKNLLLLALAFSWAGDCFLLFDSDQFFILGLSAFLLAHLFYIGLFLNLRKNEMNNTIRWWTLIVIGTYLAGFMYFLLPNLGSLAIPVFAYALVLCTMLFAAIHSIGSDRLPYWLLVAGALSFVCSDSLLAIDKFDSKLPFAGVLIMSTYGLSQAMIVIGTMTYKSGPKK